MNTTLPAAGAPIDWELVIGLEVHCQLKTRSKIFCGCATSFGEAPNTNTCPVCLGLPGALPVLNAHAVELATRAALALGCVVHNTSVFARKNYFYPDLPKGYQISQFDQPIATGGTIVVDDTSTPPRAIRVHRVHMEEDAGKSVHDRFRDATAIDLNRAGTPLIEIVSEPEIHSAADAVSYLRRLKQILEYTEVSDANMEEGSLRVDVNISIRPRGQTALGTKTEVKNLNSFSSAERAVEVEFARQRAILESGGRVEQQTLLYDEKRNQVRSARSKEGSHDYRYFPEPDLPPLVLTDDFVRRQQVALPELPAAKRHRYAEDLGLSQYDARVLTDERPMAEYFEAAVAAGADAKGLANWITGDIAAHVNANRLSFSELPFRPEQLAEMVKLIDGGKISGKIAKEILPELLEKGGSPAAIVEAKGLGMISDPAAITAIVEELLAAHPEEVEAFRGGKTKLQGFFVGQLMKKTGGKADPKLANQILNQKLKG